MDDATKDSQTPNDDAASNLEARAAERLPFPPRERRFAFVAPAGLSKLQRKMDRRAARMVERLGANAQRRRRTALAGSAALNIVMLTALAIYGRVHIFVPNKPAESISIVYVDLPTNVPVLDLRDPEIAPPEPEPIPEPEIKPEPEPEPAKPVEEATPEVEPEPAPKAEPEPIIDFTPEPAFARPSEDSAPPSTGLAPNPAELPLEGPLPGEIVVDGSQAPSPDEDQPLVSVEPSDRAAEAGANEDDAESETEIAREGEVEAADEGAAQRDAGLTEKPPEKPTGDDMFDEEPVFSSRRFTLPAVELPKGDTVSTPGDSGVVAIYCPEEFTDREKAAECAGRPEIRSGWRPGSSGEDFSKAAAILKDRDRHGDFSGDAVTFGPQIAREMEARRRIEDLEDFRKDQNLGDTGLADDPAAGTRPQIGKGIAEPSWTKRDDPLVDHKDVERLRKELEAAERAKQIDDE